jgi:hypothetical protein
VDRSRSAGIRAASDLRDAIPLDGKRLIRDSVVFALSQAVLEYLAKYPYSDFLNLAEDYLQQALQVWFDKRAPSPSPTPAAAPTSATKSARKQAASPVVAPVGPAASKSIASIKSASKPSTSLAPKSATPTSTPKSSAKWIWDDLV